MSLFGPIYILTALFVTLLDWLTEEKNEVEKNISSTENEFFIPGEHIGKHVHTIRPLGPSGRIIVDGKKFEAITDMGFIEKDALVEIIGIRYHQFVVIPIDVET